MADNDAPLTSLCSICYTNPPKYVCPRDHARTCSLPCYKRHQQRASCNGKRDPTAYVKKETLTTASGIDHDFNFLTGVERVFDKADRERQDRGIGQVDQSQKKRWNSYGPLQQYLRHHQIIIDRAPLGMSRQKANQTRYIQKSKKIVWTVEWIDADGSKRLTEVHESATLSDAYSAMLADKERESKKRKRASSPDTPSKSQSQQPKSDEQNVRPNGESDTDNKSFLSVQQDNKIPDSAPPGDSHPKAPPLESSESPSLIGTDNSSNPSETQTNDTRTLILSRIQSEQSRQAALREAKVPIGPPFFYLLRPHTSSASRVLVPLLPDQTLTSSLELRTVLEFPTIYILDQAQTDLPQAYTTEDAYLKKKKEEDREVEELLRAVPDSAAGGRVGAFGERAAATTAGGAGQSDLDPSKILEMLKRDVPT